MEGVQTHWYFTVNPKPDKDYKSSCQDVEDMLIHCPKKTTANSADKEDVFLYVKKPITFSLF